jgi:hypothetical protein
MLPAMSQQASLAQRYRADLLALVDKASKHAGMADATLSRMASSGDPKAKNAANKLVLKLRRGDNLMIESLERLEACCRVLLARPAVKPTSTRAKAA